MYLVGTEVVRTADETYHAGKIYRPAGNYKYLFAVAGEAVQ